MKVLFVSSEAYPFMKTGGLGDVSYALPKALRKLGIDARVMIPKYSDIDEKFKKSMTRVSQYEVNLGWRNQYCGVEYYDYAGLPFYFVDNEYYFKRGGSYGFYDDGERFSFFSKAVAESVNHLNDFRPDIVHLNDWHTGMIAPLIRQKHECDNIKLLFTIHNLKYQGVFPKKVMTDILGLSEDYFSEDKIKYYNGISFMKAGLNYSNKISTVSNTYMREIQTPEYGEGLDGLLKMRKNDVWGIVNGIDTEFYNPSCDWEIYEKYDLNSIDNKFKNKLMLQKELGLWQNSDIPMIGIVTRIEDQKGFDLITQIFDELMKQNVQFVLLGKGNPKYEGIFRGFADKYKGKVSANFRFDNILAKKIYAASDFFLMPSKFEPCGIGQLIALRYGSVPIVRETGGLVDTVRSYNDYTKEGNGFSFRNYNAHDMLYTINRAISVYANRGEFRNLQRRGMQEDNSWQRSAEIYINLYNSL